MRRRYGSGDIPRDAGGRRILSERVESVAYVHAHDGERYRHTFAAGVRAVEGPRGTIILYRPDGRAIIEES
jgi:hypothetical protein